MMMARLFSCLVFVFFVLFGLISLASPISVRCMIMTLSRDLMAMHVRWPFRICLFLQPRSFTTTQHRDNVRMFVRPAVLT